MSVTVEDLLELAFPEGAEVLAGRAGRGVPSRGPALCALDRRPF